MLMVLLMLLLIAGATQAQDSIYSKMLRVYEDNDIINIAGDGTDQGYTNGTRLDWFYIKKQRPRFFIDRLLPAAGDSSVNTYGWGIMQVMITPRDIWKRKPDPSDYPYSGALFVTHSLHTTNSIKKYNLQTSWLAGIMGPQALAGETQKLVHSWVAFTKPQGWDHQLKTDLLLNASFAVEKQLFHIHQSVEVIGGSQVFAGTAFNGASLYSLIRIGKMTPYFNGYISQYSHKAGKGLFRQIYFILHPGVEWAITNALLDGGIFNHNKENRIIEHANPNEPAQAPPTMERNRLVAQLDYGVAIAAGRIGISFTQSMMTPAIKTSGGQEIGNVSVYFCW
jgi:hypothetical protein